MPADNTIEVKLTPPDLLERLRDHPKELNEGMQEAMYQSLLHIQYSVGSYPVYKSKYQRTGQLGRSLGVSESGGRIGFADEQEVKPIGQHVVEGVIGTNLKYAPYVIGDGPGPAQAKHMRHWWTMKTVKAKAEKAPGIVAIFEKMVEKLAKKLGGGNG